MDRELENAFKALEKFTNLEKSTSGETREYRLDRMEKILSHFGNPHKGIPVFHLAGSKGKGSTSFFLSALLSGQGLRVGLYQSPHLVSYTERISLGGKPFPRDTYLETLKQVLDFGDSHLVLPGGQPTTFELLTLAAFLIYKRENCEVLVIETGMGGRLDATNVVEPVVSMITPIEMEHTQFLGNTIKKIAREKAGIIKKGTPVIISPQKEEALQVLIETAQAKKAPVHLLKDQWELQKAENSPNGLVGSFLLQGESIDLTLANLGKIQLQNAAMAILALKTANYSYDTKDLSSAVLKGRMQIIKTSPAIILDGSHTTNSLNYAVADIKEAYDKIVLIFGHSAGKSAEELTPSIANRFDQIIVTTAGSFKPAPPEEAYNALTEAGDTPLLIPDTREALAKAKELCPPDGVVFITGSFHLAGAIQENL